MTRMTWTIATLLALGAGATPAQDLMKVAPAANNKLLLENEHVRVIESSLAPREHEPLHSHPEYVVYVLDGGKIEVRYASGEVKALEGKPGDTFYDSNDPPHQTYNVGDKPVRWLLVELKPEKK